MLHQHEHPLVNISLSRPINRSVPLQAHKTTSTATAASSPFKTWGRHDYDAELSKIPTKHRLSSPNLLIVTLSMCSTVRALTHNVLLYRRTTSHVQALYRQTFHATTALHLNRLLFDPGELDDNNVSSDGVPVVTIGPDDYRTTHAAKILGLHNGDTVRAGIVQDDSNDTNDHGIPESPHAGLVTDTATIQWIPQGRVKKAEPLANGKPPGSLRITLHNLAVPMSVPERPPVSLILALPRPLQLNRMLPMICQMGVDHLVLTHAQKVPRDYFGSHLFRHPQRLRERLVEGLCQAGADVRLPRVTVVRNLPRFLREDLETFFPSQQYARVLAHPERVVVDGMENTSAAASTTTSMEPVVGRFDDNVSFPTDSQGTQRRVVLAVGPEGGWVEPDELVLLTQKYGFQTVTLGPRVLRSDVAVIALMALAHEACRTRTSN